MRKRREWMVSGMMLTLILMTGNAWAQRPANPIAGPPRPGGVFGPGHIPGPSDGVNRTLPPGIFVVRTVNVAKNMVQLSDADGRTARVLVDHAVFDLKKLKSGDEILVDFVVRTSADAPLRAAGIWMK
jgi:hypothetical protein